jgi:hypothetical protein
MQTLAGASWTKVRIAVANIRFPLIFPATFVA